MYKGTTISDYIVRRLAIEGEDGFNTLKLQKLLYYVHAWSLVYFDKGIVEGDFEAWVHGPVHREVYDAYKATKSLYSRIYNEDIVNAVDGNTISEEHQTFINSVLDKYAQFSSYQLEYLTHKETPWIEARKGYDPNEICTEKISNVTMKTFYSGLLDKSQKQNG